MSVINTYRAKLVSHNRLIIILGAELALYIVASSLGLTFASLEGALIHIFLMGIVAWQCTRYANQRAQEITVDLLNRLGQGVTIANHNQHFIYVNPAFAQMLGTTPEKLVGKHATDVTPPNEHLRLNDAHQRRMQGESEAYELCLQYEDGDQINVLMAATPTYHQGMYSGTIAVVTNLMPLNETKQALEVSEKRYRNLVELSTDMVLVHAQGKIRFINQAGAKMLGADSPEQLLGEPIMQFVKPEFHPIIMKRVKQILNDGATLAPYEEVFLRLDGTDLDVEVVGMPFDDDGINSVQIIARDITERKQIEQELAQKNAFLTQVMDALGQGVLVTGKGGEIEMVNPAYAFMLGYTQQELIGKTVTDLTIEDDRHIIESAYLQRKANLMTVSEARLHRKNSDSTVPVLITATPRVENDRITGAFVIATDLTQQKLVEESLRQSEAEKNALLNALPDLIFILDEKGIFTNYVAPLEHLYIPPEEFLNKHITEVFPETLASEFIQAHQQALNTGEIQIFEYELSYPDEEDRYFEARILAYADNQVLDVVREITDRKRAELSQQEQEIQYRKLFENSTDAIYLMYEGELVLINKKFTELTGVTQADVDAGNVDITQTIAPVSRDLIAGKRKKIASGFISSARFEFVARHKDGHEYEVEVSVSTVPYKGGIATQGIARDISERKHAENALRNSEKRYRDVVEQSTEGIFITVDGIVKYTNPAFVTILGAEEKAQVIGMNNMQFLHEDYHDIVQSRQAHLLQQGKNAPSLYEKYIRLDGSIIDVEVSATPIDYDGEHGIQVIVHDLTVRKQAEKMLRENTKIATEFQQQLKTLNTVGAELAKVETLDELCRLVVKLGRERFGFDRMAFWLIDQTDPNYVWGTYGTDEMGNLRDERGMRYPIESWNIKIDDPSEAQTIYLETDVDLFDKREVVGNGWHATIVIREGGTAVGWIDADNLLSQAPLSPYQLELLLLYGNTIGALYMGKKAQEALKVSNAELTASQAALKNLIEQIPVGIQIFDKSGLCIDVNQAHLDIFGVPDRTRLVNKYNIFEDNLAIKTETFKGMQEALNGNVVHLGEREFDFSQAVEGFANSAQAHKVLNVTFFPVFDDHNEIIRIVALNDDRTESKLAEQQLRRSESNLKAIFNSVSETLILIDLEGTIHARNRLRGTVYDISEGFSTDSHNFRETLVPKLRPLFDSHIERVQQGETIHIEREHNGRWFDIYYTPVYDGKKVVGACISSAEITERKEAEEALLKSEAQLRAIFEGSNIGIAIANTAGHIISCNPAFEQMIGYTEDELKSIYFSDITHSDDIPRSMTFFKQLEAGEIDYYSYEKRYIHKSGDIVWANLNVSLFPVPGVADELTIAMAEDITQRKRTEAQLLTSESTLKTIFNSVDEALVMMDLEGNIQTFNNSALTLFDNVTGKAIKTGTPMLDYILPNRVESYQNQFDFARDGQSKLLEYQFENNTWIEVRYTPVYELETVTGVCFSAVDITERKLAESQLREFNEQLEQRVAERTRELEAANKRLQELDRLKNKFIADVSHELRTPLTVLTTRVYLLERSPPEKFPKYLDGLKAQIERLTEFAETVLDLSRIDMSKELEKLAFENVDLNQVVEEIVEAVLPRAEVAGLTLDVDLAPHALIVNGEFNQLAQIVTNLITNAIKYTIEGTITVRTARNTAQNEVVMSVEDTGMGIAEEDLARLYDRFYRGERAGQSTIPGTGLGLAIVDELVELYGGRIEMTSEVDKGSIFRVYLPLVRNPV